MCSGWHWGGIPKVFIMYLTWRVKVSISLAPAEAISVAIKKYAPGPTTARKKKNFSPSKFQFYVFRFLMLFIFFCILVCLCVCECEWTFLYILAWVMLIPLLHLAVQQIHTLASIIIWNCHLLNWINTPKRNELNDWPIHKLSQMFKCFK